MNPQELPDAYFATTLTDDEADVIRELLTSHNDGNRAILGVVSKLARHIGVLQEKILRCDADCSCDLDAPGELCPLHYEYRTIHHGTARQSTM